MPPPADTSKPPPPLPSPHLTEIITPGGVMSLLRPLSRRGTGPGMILLTPDHHEDPLAIRDGVPSPLVKWAEEGYAVVEVQARAVQAGLGTAGQGIVGRAVEVLEACGECEPKGRVGMVAYDPILWNAVASTLSRYPSVVAAAVYADASSDGSSSPEDIAGAFIPVIRHLAGTTSAPAPAGSTRARRRSDTVKEYYYPKATSYRFATPFQDSFCYNTEAVSHTRSLTHFKSVAGAPLFDLEGIWEEHCYYEFADRSVGHTMGTMVQEPYVNHVPTMTGGIGRTELSRFYQHNFIFSNAADAELELISRTVGVDRVVDEFIFKFTHDKVIDWILPGVPPTNKRVEVPMIAVVNIRGDRLYHEHISWDQGSVLRQAGLLPEYLPFPYALPGEKTTAAAAATGSGGNVEYRVPVDGIETAEKVRDRNSVASNGMLGFEVRGGRS